MSITRLAMPFIFLTVDALLTDVGIASVYSIIGELQYQVLAGKSYHQEFAFLVAVSNCTWVIDMRPEGDPKKEHYAGGNFRQFYDGKTVTAFTYFKEPKLSTDGVLLVEQDDLPNPGVGGFAPALWLAYASSCYLDQISDDRLKPPFKIAHHLRAQGFRTAAEWERYQAGKGLPKSVRYYFNRATAHPASQSTSKDDTTSAATHALWALYETDNQTNFGGTDFPGQFTLTVYEPSGELAGKRLPVYKINATTKKIEEEIPQELFTAKFAGTANVDDLRFLSGERDAGIGYRITNSPPPAPDDKNLALLNARQEYLEHFQKESRGKDPTAKRLALLSLTAIISGTLGWGLWKAKRL